MKIVFVVNHAAFFVSHRLPIALAARAAGHEVALVTGQAGSASSEAVAVEKLAAEHIQHHVCAFTSAGMNPLVELRGLWQLIRHLRRLDPSIVHCASPKGLLYGGIAARLARTGGLVLAVSGMGYLYTARGAGGLGSILRTVYSWLVRFAYGHRNKKVIVQNRDDHAHVLATGLAAAHELVLIPGSGVALSEFLAITDERREDMVLLPARLVKDKGILEFAQAAAHLRGGGLKWRFVLAGAADYRNPSAVLESEIRKLEATSAIEWWGQVTDMPAIYARARIVCLPSYREGMPKALLEAAAAGCAVVTTDAVGCREAILEGVTGDLVPVADPEALSNALGALISDPARVRSYGVAGRRLAQEKFALDVVVTRILAIYNELLVRPPRA